MFARLVSSGAPAAKADVALSDAEDTTTVAKTTLLGSVALASNEAGLTPNIAHPAAPTVPHRVAARSAGDAEGYSKVGLASWYGSQFHGRSTANGETFNRLALTAAHLSLPLPSYVRVTNLDNNRSITVRVNDRGPYSHNRLIDVSEQTAELLAFRRHGLTRVRVDYVGPAPVDTDDGQMLLATYRGPSKPAATQVAARPQPTRVAFANEANGGADEPMKRLTTRPSVLNRILMAFDVASFAGN
jgi:rare lipoprotein A (peptidoglycan hydrolase)